MVGTCTLVKMGVSLFQTTISDVEFVDTACNKGVSKEEAMKVMTVL